MLSSLPLSLACLLSATTATLAAPRPLTTAGQSIDILRRSPRSRTVEEWGTWAKNHKQMLEVKYGDGSTSQKRSSGTNLVVNQGADSSFFGSLAVGTPPVSYNVILDTGSSDLWLADSSCQVGCDKVPTFDSSKSSSFNNLSTPFNIQYGSGQAAGTLGKDTIQMAGFSVSSQVFGVCDQVSANLLNSPVSGLLGLAWQSLASSGATPLWQTLAKQGAWDSPVMSFQLTRFVNDTDASGLEPGGSFTMGFLNQSLYTGNVDFQDIPSNNPTYWLQTLSGMTVQGNSISLPSGNAALAAIDTGTTLVGGPASAIQAIFAQIPGSQPASGSDFQGYYTYPCSTTVTVTMSFGGPSWTISPADFRLTQLSRDQCLGAFFELTTGGSAPSWIVGDTFLKNVYSVFRFSPPSVGFAQLSASAIALNGVNGPIPSASIGTPAAAVTAAGGATREHNGAISHLSRVNLGLVITAFAALSGAWLL